MADLRALQDSISRQKGLIPPAQDQFFGQEMKPQRGLVENILRMLSNPSDPGIGPMAMEAPVSAGMVLSERNIPKLVEQIAKWDAATGSLREGGNSFSQLARNYLTFKYPKLMSLPAAFHEPKTMPYDIAGQYIPGRNVVQLNNEHLNDVPTAVNTIAHEITHALQSKRDPIGFNTAYIPKEANLEMYRNQPFEVGARQAGSTAMQTFLDYLMKSGQK